MVSIINEEEALSTDENKSQPDSLEVPGREINRKKIQNRLLP